MINRRKEDGVVGDLDDRAAAGNICNDLIFLRRGWGRRNEAKSHSER